MTLLDQVTNHLAGEDVPHCLIGAAAMAAPLELGGASLLVAEAADLVLLKLYAGGPQDRWDIQQMLATPDGGKIRVAVDRRLHDLPQDCTELWRGLRA